ncbi:hypothetical protein Tco_1464358, partial [Tanacetum coccineum]
VVLVAHDDPNDLYVAVCNATTVIVIDDDGSATLGDPQPSELRGSPPLVVDHAARNPAGGSRGNLGEIGGQGGAPPARECSFAIYKKCNPTSFHRNKGAVELYRWFEMTEITTLGLETANRKPWTEMKRMRFNKLVLLCLEMVPTEKKKVESYIRGLYENIKGETTSSKPTNLYEAVHMAHTLMEQMMQARAKRVAQENKRRWEKTKSSNRNNNKNRGNYKDNTRHYQYKN